MRSSPLDFIQDFTAQSQGLADAAELGDASQVLALVAELSAQDQFELSLDSAARLELAEQSGLVEETASAARFEADTAELEAAKGFETRAGLAPAWALKQVAQKGFGIFAAAAVESSEEEAPKTAPAA